MILMRNDIRNNNNKLICELLLHIFNFKEKNEVMLCKLNKIINLNNYLSFFAFGSSECIPVKKNIIKILIVGISKVIDCLHMQKYDCAYDMIDALHILPEILADNKKVNLRNYWNVYFSKLSKKYGKKELRSIKKCFRYKLFVI